MRKFQFEWMQSKVTRRVFSLFGLASLLPIVILSFFMFAHMSHTYNDQYKKELYQQGKVVAAGITHTVHEALSDLHFIGALVSMKNNYQVAELIPPDIQKVLLGVVVLKQEKVESIFGSVYLNRPVVLSSEEQSALDKGNPVLFEDVDRHDRVHILLAQKLKRGGDMIAEINTSTLFAVYHVLSKHAEWCLVNLKQNKLTFCHDTMRAMATHAFIQNLRRSYTGETEINVSNQDYELVFWKLNFSDNIQNPDWTVVLSRPISTIMSVSKNFYILFPIILLLTSLIIIIINSMLIHRILGPLYSLKKGITALASKQKQEPVIVKSGDEFEELADSFNRMVMRIDQQFHALDLLAKIDHMILSTIDVDKIIEITLRSPIISACQSMGILLLDKDRSNKGRIYFETDAGKIINQKVSLLPEEVTNLVVKNACVEIKIVKGLPQFLSPIIDSQVSTFILFPILVENSLLGAIIIGYEKLPESFETDKKSIRDLTDRIAVALSNEEWEGKLYYQAHYDKLTAIPNRLLLKARAEQLIEESAKSQKSVALLFINIDRFRTVNESLGHSAGDKYLQKIVSRIQDVLQKTDTIARLGADEFVIITSSEGDRSQLLSYISLLASRINAVAKQPIDADGQEIRLSASIGIAIWPEDGKDFNEVLKHAEVALNQSKELQLGQHLFYSKELNVKAEQRFELELKLRKSLERDELRVYCQPKVSIKENRILGMEALVRWEPEPGKIVSPVEFIPLAEQTGLIVAIGEWVLKKSCELIKQWDDELGIHLTTSVNLSMQQLTDEFLVKKISKIIETTGINPEQLNLEITESALMRNKKETINVLSQLREKGIKFEVDDFGTGYSSLSYLKQFPVSYLKIDQSFVSDLPSDLDNAAIVRATIQLGHALGLKVIAEGVETQEQLDFLGQNQCDIIQGYYYSKPIPANEFIEYVKNWKN